MIGRDEFFRRPVRAADRAGEAAAARQRRPRRADRLDALDRRATSTPASDSHAWVVWCVTVLVPALLAWARLRRPRARQRAARRWPSTSPCST